eukprot:m.46443 g.46443  ORF g.46443 m.46443 type:complete len:756 (-) comp10372_c0_seq2:29-2296(-)
MYLSYFSDTHLYSRTIQKIQIYNPNTIIYPDHQTTTLMSSQLPSTSILSEAFPSVNFVSVKCKYFSEAQGVDNCMRYCVEDYLSTLQVAKTKFYTMAAAAALFKYVEYVQNSSFARGSLKILFEGSEKTMIISGATANGLELLYNGKDMSSKGTLFATMNQCKTKGGAKLLRTELLQPSTSTSTIQARQQAVEELLSNEEMFMELGHVLEKFGDLDKLISGCIQIPKMQTPKTAEHNIETVIVLKSALELAPALLSVIEPSQTDLLKAFRTTLKDARYKKLLDKVEKVVNGDTGKVQGLLNTKKQKMFLVKDKVNYLLDVARKTYSENIDAIMEVVVHLSEKYNLPLKAAHSAQRGWHITAPWNQPSSELPAEFEQIQIKGKKKKTAVMTTSLLRRFNNRVKENQSEIYLLTDSIINGVILDVRESLGCLYKLSDAVAMLDMLRCFADLVTLNPGYRRPDFGLTLAVKQGKHPVLLCNATAETIANDTIISNATKVHIVVGPNMSGKSVLLKQLALLQIMAQIGSFVPAQYACFRIADQVFARFSSDDSASSLQCSSFLHDCDEVNYIVQNATNKSLILLDEIGRGTSPYEGSAMCFAVLEHFILNKDAFVLCASHFPEVLSLQMYPTVRIWHMEVKLHGQDSTEERRITYTHKMRNGNQPSNSVRGGLALAHLSSLPNSIIKRAEELSIHLDSKQTTMRTQIENSVAEEASMYQMVEHLKQLQQQRDNLSNDTLIVMLRDIQTKCRASFSSNID